jgi:hypothetical protein
MEGQDHDLLVRIDERVTQIHNRLGGYDDRFETIETKVEGLTNNQTKAMAVISFIAFAFAFIGKNIVDFVASLIRR